MTQKPFISDGISFIGNDDRDEISTKIRDKYWPHIRAKGNHLVVKPYTRDIKSDAVMLPEAMRVEDQHHSVAAQVIDIGPVAYTDKEITGDSAWVQVGDWVIIPRAAGARVARKDTMFRIVRENDVIALIKDPEEWEIRISSTRY